MEVSFNSYYLYKKYEKRVNQPWIPVFPEVLSIDADGTMSKVLKTSGDPVCYVEPEERWVDTGGYACEEIATEYRKVSGTPYCNDFDKCFDIETQVSNDGGATWNTVSSTTEIIEINSTECGWSPGMYSGNYLTFIARDSTVIWLDNYSVSERHLQFSIDGGEWENVRYIELLPGQHARVRGDLAYNSPSYTYGWFSSTSQFDVEGNFLSLYYMDDFSDKTAIPDDVIKIKFGPPYLSENYKNRWSKVVNAKNLYIPTPQVCSNMFFLCAELKTAPKLTFTDLSNGSFYYMFCQCKSLTIPPELPATILSDRCYMGMFAGCYSLIKTPKLPATTVPYEAYHLMFNGCHALTTVQEINASNVGYRGCDGMFYGCTSLTTAPSLSARTIGESAYREMFCDCTSLTTVQSVLPATTLASHCYENMFANCTSLTTAPVLPATSLEKYCYARMFYGCSSLNKIICLANTDYDPGDDSKHCTEGWVTGVAGNGTFYKNANMIKWSIGTYGIPEGWTMIDYVS